MPRIVRSYSASSRWGKVTPSILKADLNERGLRAWLLIAMAVPERVYATWDAMAEEYGLNVRQFKEGRKQLTKLGLLENPEPGVYALRDHPTSEAEASEEELRPDTAEGVVTEISVQPAATENPELPEQQVTLTLPEGQQKPFNEVKKDFFERADFIGLDLDAADAWAVKFNRNWPEALQAMGKLYKDDIDTLNREAYASRQR